MDLNTVTDVVLSPEPTAWRDGDAWLGGGTYLFSQPHVGVQRLLDLTTLGWPPLVASATGLEIAATCTIAELAAYVPLDPRWKAAPLFRQCCDAFLASFKIWNTATVGGNLCNALPAGPMISLSVALEGTIEILTPQGGHRRMPALDLVIGDGVTALAPGEMVRAVHLPDEALTSRTAMRRMSLNDLGRSAALIIGRLDGDDLVVTVTAATVRPVRIAFAGVPSPLELDHALSTLIDPALYHDDVHGQPQWRRQLTARLAAEVRRELVEGVTAGSTGGESQ